LLGHSGGFRLPNTFSSYKLANVINMRYHTIRMIPYFLSNFQPLRWVANTRNKTVESRERVEYVIPARNISVHKINTQNASQFSLSLSLSLHPSNGLHIAPPKLVTVNGKVRWTVLVIYNSLFLWGSNQTSSIVLKSVNHMEYICMIYHIDLIRICDLHL